MTAKIYPEKQRTTSSSSAIACLRIAGAAFTSWKAASDQPRAIGKSSTSCACFFIWRKVEAAMTIDLKQAVAIADALNEHQMARATVRFDRLLRIGLNHDEALVVAVEAEIVTLARQLMHSPPRDRRGVSGQTCFPTLALAPRGTPIVAVAGYRVARPRGLRAIYGRKSTAAGRRDGS
jgi:hypothetical protein